MGGKKNKLAKSMMTREKRFKDDKEKIPGPGQYTVLPKINSGAVKYVKPRKMKEKESTPGPGAYHVPYSIAVVPMYNMKANVLTKSI